MKHMKSNTNMVAIIVTAVLAALRGSKNGVEMPPASGASVHFGEANVMMTAASLRKLGRAIYQAMRQGKAGITNLPKGSKAYNPVPKVDLDKAMNQPARASDEFIASRLGCAAYANSNRTIIHEHLIRQASTPKQATAKAATRQAGKTAKKTTGKVVDGHARFTALEAQYEWMRRWLKREKGIIMPVQNRAAFEQPNKVLRAACLAGGLTLPQ